MGRPYARYPILTGKIVGVLELEPHEGDALGALLMNGKKSATDRENRDFFAAGAPKRLVCAALAQEPG